MNTLILTRGQKFNIPSQKLTGSAPDIILQGYTEVDHVLQRFHLVYENVRAAFHAQEQTGWTIISGLHRDKHIPIHCLAGVKTKLPGQDIESLCCVFPDDENNDFYYSKWEFRTSDSI